MIDSNSRMIATQAELITKLNQQTAKLSEECRTLRAQYDDANNKAVFYNMMSEAISKEPALQSIWDEFVVMLKLIVPEVENAYSNVHSSRVRKSNSLA